ncbi:MAG TPA: hypothetical protein VFA32_19490 [Dehalococcoidia bacterium]|nr:hypothetical protein [Dehalococcoidia bacterium]
MDAIQQAGFVDVELVSTADVFAGAEGEGSAHALGLWEQILGPESPCSGG